MKSFLVVLCLMSMFVTAQSTAAVAAEKSEMQAQYDLAKSLFDPTDSADVTGEDGDAQRGLSLLKDLARQGHADSLETLIFYYSSPSLGGDYYETIFWLTESYRHGNVDNMVDLGDFYAKDWDRYPHNWHYNWASTPQERIEASFPGIKADIDKAFGSYQLAANHQTKPNERGMIFLGEAYSKGKGTSIDHAKAVFWLDKGMSRLSTDDMSSNLLEDYEEEIKLLRSYYRGEIDPSLKNTSKAIYWHDEYAYLFYPVVEHPMFGDFYLKGIHGRSVDIKRAQKFFNRSSLDYLEGGLQNSGMLGSDCQHIGVIYLFGGEGVEPDYAKGKQYLQRALENGADPDEISLIESRYKVWRQKQQN